MYVSFYGPNIRAYSDLPAVDILSFIIHKAAAAMWPLATIFVWQLVYFAVLVVLFIELFFCGLQLGIDSRTQHLQILTTETKRLSIQ